MTTPPDNTGKSAPPHPYLAHAPEFFFDLHYWLLENGFTLERAYLSESFPAAWGRYRLGHMVVQLDYDRWWSLLIGVTDVKVMFDPRSFVDFLDGVERPVIDPDEPDLFHDGGAFAYHEDQMERSAWILRERFNDIRAAIENEKIAVTMERFIAHERAWLEEHFKAIEEQAKPWTRESERALIMRMARAQRKKKEAGKRRNRHDA
jgi:hypothetical protein